MGIPVFFFVLVAIVVASSDVRSMRSKPVVDKRRVEKFKQHARIEPGCITLPEEVVVEFGDVVLKGYWTVVGSGRSSRYVYKSEVSVVNPEVAKLRFVDLSKLCGKPFFVFANRMKTLIVDAPGLRISSGEFKDMTVVCLEPSSIPEREVEIEAGNHGEHGKAKIKVSSKGFDGFSEHQFKRR